MDFYAGISGKKCRGGLIRARGLRGQGRRASRKSLSIGPIRPLRYDFCPREIEEWMDTVKAR